MKPSGVRLFVILARGAPVGVVFRRGPSKQVLLIKWDTARDHFEYGQWFKGRIYERRCDLSPSGNKLIYFAAKFKGPLYSWTAVSQPPYLTALALWPKGDTGGGGGLFESETVIALNHGPIVVPPAKGLELPTYLKVRPLGMGDGGEGEEAIYHRRLIRDGWILTQESRERKRGSPWITYDPPRIYAKGLRLDNGHALTLEMLIKGIKEQAGPWYVIEYQVVRKDGDVVLNLGRTDWADWDRTGDLLFAKDGRLHRLRPDLGNSVAYTLERAVELADLRSLQFEEKAAPDEALRW